MTQWLLGSAGLEHFLDVFFNFRAGQHDLTAAARAADLEIHADPEHLEAGSSARVFFAGLDGIWPVSYTDLRAHETKANLVCRHLLEKKKFRRPL